jgi:hypothetical protein
MTADTCLECQGTGTATCPVCRGKGKVGGFFGLGARRCGVCEGAGTEPCPTCMGKGSVAPSTSTSSRSAALLDRLEREAPAPQSEKDSSSRRSSTSGELDTLRRWIGSGKPTNLTCLTDKTKRAVVERFFQERASADGAPALTHYLLEATGSARFPLLVATTGEISAQHQPYDAAGIREHVVPGGGWDQLWGAGVEGRANFAMPRCTLETTVHFDEVAARIEAGDYRVARVISPSADDGATKGATQEDEKPPARDPVAPTREEAKRYHSYLQGDHRRLSRDECQRVEELTRQVAGSGDPATADLLVLGAGFRGYGCADSIATGCLEQLGTSALPAIDAKLDELHARGVAKLGDADFDYLRRLFMTRKAIAGEEESQERLQALQRAMAERLICKLRPKGDSWRFRDIEHLAELGGPEIREVLQAIVADPGDPDRTQAMVGLCLMGAGEPFAKEFMDTLEGNSAKGIYNTKILQGIRLLIEQGVGLEQLGGLRAQLESCLREEDGPSPNTQDEMIKTLATIGRFWQPELKEELDGFLRTLTGRRIAVTAARVLMGTASMEPGSRVTLDDGSQGIIVGKDDDGSRWVIETDDGEQRRLWSFSFDPE